MFLFHHSPRGFLSNFKLTVYIFWIVSNKQSPQYRSSGYRKRQGWGALLRSLSSHLCLEYKYWACNSWYNCLCSCGIVYVNSLASHRAASASWKNRRTHGAQFWVNSRNASMLLFCCCLAKDFQALCMMQSPIYGVKIISLPRWLSRRNEVGVCCSCCISQLCIFYPLPNGGKQTESLSPFDKMFCLLMREKKAKCAGTASKSELWELLGISPSYGENQATRIEATQQIPSLNMNWEADPKF